MSMSDQNAQNPVRIPAWLQFRGRLGISAVTIVAAVIAVIVARQIPLRQAAAQAPVITKQQAVAGQAQAGQRTAPQPAARQPAAPGAAQPGVQPAARPTTGANSANNPAATRPVAKNAAPSAAAAKNLAVMAVINGEQITRAQLGKECMLRYGEEVLESMINRMLILDACQQKNLTITEKDVDDEIARVAQKFGLTVENWLTLLRDERGVSLEQYRREIIWPTIALRNLAAEEIEVTPLELKKAWETEYGPRVKVRIIGGSREAKIREAHAKAKANPAAFPELAKEYCEDPNIASAGGAIPPIRKYLGDEYLERVAFSLRQGQVSEVVKVQNQFFILLCEGHEPERFVDPKFVKLEEERMRERIRDQKLRTASQTLFTDLQKSAKVVNELKNQQLAQQAANVAAATVNNRPITVGQLSEECIARHGRNVLDGEINRKLLTQQLTRHKIAVTNDDLGEEVGRAAMLYGYINADGAPDVEKWLAQVQEQDGATIELYLSDAVWPTVALKKLVRNRVSVTDDDLHRGFEANYGPRVEVLAIVLNNQREAQKVWEMARNQPTDAFFGELAGQYSVEPVSKGNLGKVPPVRKFGGQPIVEDEAFKLKPGQLSSILVVGDKFIILRCLGRTQPVVTQLTEVQDELYADLLEKKLTAEMTKEFEAIRSVAQIDNFLAGTSQSGKRAPAGAAATQPGGANAPAARVGSLPGKQQ
jgi:parvulin-like peptidyl-prolyl isomerase